jgi:CRISPR/Cas system-associated endonuclease/helicase Cas3
MMNTVTFLMGGVMRREFAGIPTIVLSSTVPATVEKPAFRALMAEMQGDLANKYAARRHDFVVNSGHYIQRD